MEPGLSKGVPQGSLLGPLIFALYVSDLSEVVKVCFVHSYADETQLYLSYHLDKRVEANIKFSSDLQAVAEWFSAHGLNTKKLQL